MMASGDRPKATTTYSPTIAKVMALLPAPVVELSARQPTLFLCARLLGFFAVFVIVDYFFLRAGDLPAASYERPYLILGVLERLGAMKLAIMAVVAVLLLRYGSPMDRWSSFELGRQVRWFVVFLAALVAWPLTTYGYNFYFDQGHYVDRALVALLVPLIWFRPVFLLPFLLLIFPLLWQLGEPGLGSGSIFAHKLQVLHVLNAFAAAFLVHAATGSRRTDGFFFSPVVLLRARTGSRLWQRSRSIG